MNKAQREIVDSMKHHLHGRVSEWLGNDIPDEGDEDFDTWQEKVASIYAIESIDDVVAYLEDEGIDEDDFYTTGDYLLISAGMKPEHVPGQVVSELGDCIAEQTWENGSWVNVYAYDGKFFVINEVETTAFDDRNAAMKSARLGDDTYDNINHSILR